MARLSSGRSLVRDRRSRGPDAPEVRGGVVPLQLGPGGGPRESVHLVAAPELPEVEIMVAEQSARRFRVYHDTYTVCVVPRRWNLPVRSDWWYRGRMRASFAGEAMLMEPGEVHVVHDVTAPADFFVVLLRPQLVARLAGELGLPPEPHLRLAQSDAPDLNAAFEGFYRAFRRGDSRLELETRLAGALRLLLIRAGEAKPPSVRGGPHPSLRLARDYLHAHLADAVALDDLVGLTGLSRYHLVRTFRRAYGLPPHAYQIQLRVAAACELLRRGRQPAEVEVGFADQSHLGRHFKRSLGMTPGQFAGAVGHGRPPPLDPWDRRSAPLA